MSPRLRRAFPTPEAVRDHLFHEHKPFRRLLTTNWRRRRLSGEDPGWALWTRPEEDSRQQSISHKLYVSPLLEQIRPAFHTVLPIITDSQAIGFKIGAELPYLIRPDKLVIYFDSREEMARVGALLRAQLADVAAHGVPFTCQMDESGLLSWGMDPPDGGNTQRSWRVWLAERLARAMIEAPPEERVAAALKRAESLGVDSVSWEPRDVVWGLDGPN